MTQAVRGERRVVTALFCDVKGSTAIAEQLDPEEWAEIINEAFGQLIGPIERYEGLVARLMGDAVLAFFGAPTAHEDDPHRAVLAALEIVEAIRPYRERLQRERGIADFDVRIGINTGLAILGDVGRGVAVEYTALGDAVNVAARVQAAAGPGTVLITDSTARLIEDAFELEPLGSFEVKGRSAPVRMLRVLRRRTGAARAAPPGPLVGRERELAALEDAVAAVREGQGRIVSLVGDAGLGKTRLIDEMRRRAADLRWYLALGQSYGASRPFLLFRQHVLAWCGAFEDEEPAVIRAKLAAAVERVAPDAADEAARAAELVVGVERDPSGAPGGPEVRERIERLITLLVRRELASGPAVIAFDDLHWSDVASGELLGQLMALPDDAPVLLLLAFRPDRQSVAWRTKQRAETDFPHRYVEVALRPLEDRDCERLIDALLAGRPIPAGLRRSILRKAEGNPLFVEQFVRSLADHPEAAVAEIPIPDTLVGLLASRIDRLEDPVRRTLQAAAVIGRVFEHRVLSAIAEADGELDRQLALLQRVDLVREERRVPDRVYAFRHGLLQEVAYGSLLQRRRRELHARVGAVLEDLLGERPEEYAGLIGRHFAEAGDQRAMRYLRSAGERAVRLHALDDAIDHFDRALALTPKVSVETDDLVALYGGKGRALELRADYDGALATYAEMERAGRERADRRLELAGLARSVSIYATPTTKQDLPRAKELLDAAIPAARELGDRELLARLLWNDLQTKNWAGDRDGAVRSGEEGLSIARELGLREQEAYLSLDLPRVYRMGGHPPPSIWETVRRGIELFRELGNRPMVADGLSTVAVAQFGQGEYDAALRSGSEALAISEEIGNLWGQSFSRFATPFIQFERGDWGVALREWEAGIRFAREAGFRAGELGPGVDMAFAVHTAGDLGRALRLLERPLALSETMGDLAFWPRSARARVATGMGRLDEAREWVDRAASGRVWLVVPNAIGLFHTARAELELALGRHDAALDAARTGIAALRDAPYLPFLDELLWLQAEAGRAAGDLVAAQAALLEALAITDRLGSKRMRWRILASLAAVAQATGDGARAATMEAEARSIVDSIAASLGPDDLAERFRATAPARALATVARG